MSVLLGDLQNNTILTPKHSKIGNCKGLTLLKENFLSEFLTREEKRKVLENLGINQQIEWGEIGGYIENQPDLQTIIKNCILKETDKEGAVLQIEYTNEEYPNINTLKDALDKVLYKDLTLTVSVSPNIVERGTNLESAELKWSYNKISIKNQQLNGEDISTDLRSLILEGPITSTTISKITGSDGVMTVTNSATINFYPGIYYGVGKVLPDISTSSKQLKPSRVCTIIVNAGKSDYIWIYLPNEYGNPTFTVGGFSGGFLKIAEMQYKSTKYNVWRSDNVNLGNTTIHIT